MPLLEVRELTKCLRLNAVRSLDFDVNVGGPSIIGLNGAGKTTVFNLLTGFYHPDSGSIKFKGQSTGLKPHRISHMGIGRTFQIVRPFPGMARGEQCKGSRLSRAPSRRRTFASGDTRAYRREKKAVSQELTWLQGRPGGGSGFCYRPRADPPRRGLPASIFRK